MIVAVANQKGGTGKTTVAAHLAHGLAERGRVMAVDLDTQGQLATFLGQQRGPGVGEWLVGHPLNGHVVAARDNLVLLPGDKATGPAVTALLMEHEGRLPGDLLSKRLERFRAAVEYVVLDTSPAASQLQALALAAADLVVIPAACDYISPASVRDMAQTIRVMKLEIPTYILPTFYDARTRASAEALAHYRRVYGRAVLPPIHAAAVIARAAGEGQTVFEAAPRSRAADEFRTIVHIVATTEV